MFKIGDFVRVIPESYVMIAKNFYLYRETWNESNPENKTVMLGGGYQIHDVKYQENGSVFYLLLKDVENYQGWIISGDLLDNKDVINCPFVVGDNVVLNLSEEEIKKQYFPMHRKEYSFEDKNAVYKITEVLNDFYIFLNYQKGEPNSTPFRWDNFKKV